MLNIARYTIDLSIDLEKKLKQYMTENNIKYRSVALKNCILDATNKEKMNSFLFELDKKLNRILYRQNLNRRLLEQIFANMGFPLNENVEEDILLKNFYRENNSRFERFS